MSVRSTLEGGGSLPGGSVTKNLPAVEKTRVWSLGWEDRLEEGMATFFSTLARKIPWTEEPVGYSPQGHTEPDMTEVAEQQQ